MMTLSIIFFFNDTATTEIYTLSLHDALPICHCRAGGRDTAHGHAQGRGGGRAQRACDQLGELEYGDRDRVGQRARDGRSEEHTSELQSRLHLVCRLLLEKKKKTLPSKIASRN